MTVLDIDPIATDKRYKREVPDMSSSSGYDALCPSGSDFPCILTAITKHNLYYDLNYGPSCRQD